jgi:hypothetical protein
MKITHLNSNSLNYPVTSAPGTDLINYCVVFIKDSGEEYFYDLSQIILESFKHNGAISKKS